MKPSDADAIITILGKLLTGYNELAAKMLAAEAIFREEDPSAYDSWRDSLPSPPSVEAVLRDLRKTLISSESSSSA